MASLVHRRHRMVRLCLLAIAGLVLVTARPADACSCASPSQACEAIARSRVVFVGTPGETVQAAPREFETTVDVEEVFRGSLGQTATIKMTGGGASCEHSYYKPGERMLIYADQRPDGTLAVSMCSRTAPVARAAGDLAELRRAARRGTGHVSGRIGLSDGMPRANIRVSAVGTQFAARTDGGGAYRLALPPGTYTIEPEGDPDFAPRKAAPVEVGAPGACVKHDVTEQWNGRVRGTLRDRKGQPAANVLVRVFPASTTVPPVLDGMLWNVGASARSDASGAYELGPLPPGTYRVAVGAPFDPADPFPATYHPKQIVVPRGGLVPDVDLVLPPRLQMHAVTVRVRFEGNIPAHVNYVLTMTELASQRVYQRYRSSHPGTFDLTEAAGTTVELRACANELDCTKTARVRVDRDVTVDLVLTIP